MALRLDHVELAVHDAEALIAAYAPAGLGATGGGLDGGKGRVVLQSGQAPPLADRLRACDTGIAHFCIQSVEPSRVWDDLAQAGMVWNDELVGLGTGYLYAYGYDVEGNLVELEGTAEAWDGRDSWLAHIAIVTPDIDRAVDFYERLIGVTSHGFGRYRHPNMDRVAALRDVDARAAWLATDALTLELWQYLMPATGPRSIGRPTGYRTLGFTSANLVAELERLSDGGIRVEASSEELRGEDPDGNAFRILPSTN